MFHDCLMLCRDAVNINVLGVQRMLDVCQSLPNLAVNKLVCSLLSFCSVCIVLKLPLLHLDFLQLSFILSFPPTPVTLMKMTADM